MISWAKTIERLPLSPLLGLRTPSEQFWQLKFHSDYFVLSAYLKIERRADDFLGEDDRKIASFALLGLRTPSEQFWQLKFHSDYFMLSAYLLFRVCSESEARARVVLATVDDHMEEAIETTKAEQVIAVTTTTLYGSACDACAIPETTAIL